MVKVPEAEKVSVLPEEFVVCDHVKCPLKVSSIFELVLDVLVDDVRVIELGELLLDC